MKKFLVITIDVEPDCTPNWKYSSPLTFDGVKEGIGKRLQPLFDKYGIHPTYLINNVVLEDQHSIEVFKNMPGKFELGTHLHPEFIEPEKKYSDYSGKKGEANCCFYPPDIEFEKIKNITDLFSEKFGYQPTSFRAGRFSAGINTVASLKKLNYKIDTSVTPNIRWDDSTRERPVDFRSASDQPYWIGNESMTSITEINQLLEVPVSIVRKPMSLGEYFKHLIKNKRVPYKAAKLVWLRPVFSNVAEFQYVLDQLNREHNEKEIIVYNMMFHNVEVMPGLSPYSQTEADCQHYLQLLEWLFTYSNKNHIKSIGLSVLHDVFSKK